MLIITHHLQRCDHSVSLLMAHAKKKSASGAVSELPCDRDDSLLLRYIKNLPVARESKQPPFKVILIVTRTFQLDSAVRGQHRIRQRPRVGMRLYPGPAPTVGETPAPSRQHLISCLHLTTPPSRARASCPETGGRCSAPCPQSPRLHPSVTGCSPPLMMIP